MLHYEAGGKLAKLLAKKQKAKNTIYKVRDPTTNSIHCKLKDTQQSFETFYKNTQPKIDVRDEQSMLLISEITNEEIKKAISNLKRN